MHRTPDPKSEWCNLLAGKLCTVNPNCCFGFKKRWLQKQDSRKNADILFKARAYCTFSTCTITCDAHVTKQSDGEFFNLKITHSGTVRHRREERRVRHIRGVERAAVEGKLKHNSPSAIYNQGMFALSNTKLMSGSRDGIGRTKYVFQKIASEAKKKEQRSEDLVTALILLKDEFIKATSSYRYPGYIQRIHVWPFAVMCFTEVGVRLYHHMVKDHTLFCDATGTIVTLKGDKNLQSVESPILYYSLVIQNSKGNSPVAVAEMITSEHTITSVTHFLECFRRQEATVYGWRNVSMPHRIVIDRSLVLLNSFLRVYNMESFSQYLHRSFRVVSGCADEKDYNGVFILACVSHVMNSAKHLCRKLL